MKIFNCILGIFSIFAAFYCIFYPGLTFLNVGWIITILMGAWGICMMFDFFSNRKERKRQKGELAAGIFGLVAGIAAAILSVIAMVTPAVRLTIDAIVLYMLAGWILIGGIMSLGMAFKTKKITDSKKWILTLIMGILLIISGIYCFGHLILLAQFTGVYIGVALVVYGVRLIISVFE